MPDEMHSHKEGKEMSDNLRGGDVERLRILRINHPTAHASRSCATCFLLAQIDTRDADLREKDEEVAFLRSVLEGFSEAIKQRDLLIFGDDTAEVKIKRLKSEVDRLRSAPATRVVEAARELKFGVYPARGSGFIWTLVDGDPGKLSRALAEYGTEIVASEDEE